MSSHFTHLLTAFSLIVSLAACSAPNPQPTSSPDSVVSDSPVISATGIVVPPQKAILSFGMSGEIVRLYVAAGDAVFEGDILAELDTTQLDYRVAEAEATVAIAEATLEKVKTGPRPQEIEQARDQASAASAAVAQAAADRDRIKAGATQAEILNAEARLKQAQIEAEVAEVNFNEANAASVHSEQMQGFADYLRLTQQNVAAAQAYLEDLENGAETSDLQLADAQVWAAAAERAAAAAYVALLEAGPRPENIAVAEAQLAQTRSALQSAEAARDKAIVRAPFDGMVSEVYVRQHEWASPGNPVVLLAGGGSLLIETTDLNEIDVARVVEGAPVSVSFDALPDVTVSGTVLRIATRASEGAGVNYTVRIALDEVPEALRWGMTAFVDITVE